MASRAEEFDHLQQIFQELQREHRALEREAFDREAHERHRAHLRAYTEALHRWRTVADDNG
jgi:hypothetical protein